MRRVNMQLSSFQNGGSRFTVTLSKRSTQKSVVHFIQDPLLCEKPRHRRSGGRIDYTECGGRGGMLQNTRNGRGRGIVLSGLPQDEGLCASTAKVIENQLLLCSRCEKSSGVRFDNNYVIIFNKSAPRSTPIRQITAGADSSISA